MQKTRNQSDHPRQRKRPKTVKELPNSNLPYFGSFFAFTQPRIIRFTRVDKKQVCAREGVGKKQLGIG